MIKRAFFGLIVVAITLGSAAQVTAASAPLKVNVTATSLGQGFVSIEVKCRGCAVTARRTKLSLSLTRRSAVNATALIRRRSFKSRLIVVDKTNLTGLLRYNIQIFSGRRLIARGTTTLLVALSEPTPTPEPTPPVSVTPSPVPTATPTPVPFVPGDLPAGQTSCAAEQLAAAFAAINSERATEGLPALVMNHPLTVAAYLHSSNMALSGEIGHDHWFEEIIASGFQGGAASQNVALAPEDGALVVQQWMASLGHSANILKPTATLLGVGCVRNSNVGSRWTANFGS